MSAFLNERSPNRIRWDKHSCLTDRTQRSATAFKFGLRGGSRRHFTPAAASQSQGFLKLNRGLLIILSSFFLHPLFRDCMHLTVTNHPLAAAILEIRYYMLFRFVAKTMLIMEYTFRSRRRTSRLPPLRIDPQRWAG
jgi:hypothetical protein